MKSHSLRTVKKMTEKIHWYCHCFTFPPPDGCRPLVVGYDHHWANEIVTGLSHGGTYTSVIPPDGLAAA
jgi:hypothetical protein